MLWKPADWMIPPSFAKVMIQSESLSWPPNQYPEVVISSRGWLLCISGIGIDGMIYAGSRDSNLYAFDPNGNLKWKYPTSWLIGCAPAIGDDGTIIKKLDWRKGGGQ